VLKKNIIKEGYLCHTS